MIVANCSEPRLTDQSTSSCQPSCLPDNITLATLAVITASNEFTRALCATGQEGNYQEPSAPLRYTRSQTIMDNLERNGFNCAPSDSE